MMEGNISCRDEANERIEKIFIDKSIYIKLASLIILITSVLVYIYFQNSTGSFLSGLAVNLICLFLIILASIVFCYDYTITLDPETQHLVIKSGFFFKPKIRQIHFSQLKYIEVKYQLDFSEGSFLPYWEISLDIESARKAYLKNIYGIDKAREFVKKIRKITNLEIKLPDSALWK